MAEQSVKSKTTPRRSAARRGVSRAVSQSATGVTETGKDVGNASKDLIPSILSKIRNEEGMTLTRLMASTVVTTLGLALMKRAVRHPLVTMLGVGVIAGAIMAPDKEPPPGKG